MRSRSIPAFALLLACSATAACGQAPAPSRLDDLAERFVAIVGRDAPGHAQHPPLPEMRQELLRLNPGRERQVEEYIGKADECIASGLAEAMPRAARASARALGEERLARLVAFLEGPGGEALDRSRRGDGNALSDAQSEEWGRLRHDYGTFMYSIPNHIDPDSVNRMTRCQEDEAIRLHVRTE